MQHSEKTPEAIDLSHHLSYVARNRAESPLKGLIKYMNRPGMISMAGGTFTRHDIPCTLMLTWIIGTPNPNYFPFSTLSAEILVPNSFPLNPTSGSSSFSWLWKLFGGKEKTRSFTINKFPAKEGDLNLATSLQYGAFSNCAIDCDPCLAPLIITGIATGVTQLVDIQKELVQKIYQPAYSNWTTLVHTGNTDGWTKVVLTFMNPNDTFIVTDWTYPSALSVRPLPLQ